MTVSSATSKVQYNGNGSTTVFAYTFKVFNQNDLTVIVRSAAGTETVKTITTHYTVSGVGSAGGGNVTMLTAPASGETLTILREQDLTQELDLVENDPFPAQSLEDALDKLTFMVQQHSEEIDRSIKASRTNTITSTEFTVSAASRANKIFAFDSAGELAVTQELGTYRGNWATATAFAQRDIVKDTSNNNIYIVVTAHTSTGSQPISSNADVAKWALIVDAASATTSASAAASSASAAATSETNASNSASAASGSASAASGSASAASTSASNASTAQSAAEAARDATLAAYDSFDDRYLGAKTSDPSVDNDGNALVAGALYFNSVSGIMKLYTGSAWIAAYVTGVASSIGFTPAGGISATDVQAAIQEVDTEKANLASPTFTGTPAAPTATVGTNTTQIATTAFVLANGAPLASPTFTGTPAAPTAANGTNTTQIATTAFVLANGGAAGEVSFFAMSSAPTGWLKANGAAVSRSTYAALFTAIGTTFGVGDGSTTFNVPELRGEFIRALADGRAVDTGRALGSAQAEDLLAHSHGFRAYGGSGSALPNVSMNASLGTVGSTSALNTAIVNSSGVETRPRNIALLACIKY